MPMSAAPSVPCSASMQYSLLGLGIGAALPKLMCLQLIPALHGSALILLPRQVLDRYPGVQPPPAELLDAMPALAPRMYSLSNAPAQVARVPFSMHCVPCTATYAAYNPERLGGLQAC